VASGRRCFPVGSLDAAAALAGRLDRPLLVGELGGNMPYGFDLTNSPADLAARHDVERPMILISTSGTRLIHEAGRRGASYVACLRNWAATAAHLIYRHEPVVLLGAGTRGEFREEDQLCAAWIAERLVDAGFRPDVHSLALVKRWSGRSPDAFVPNHSVEYLTRTGQLRDLKFILSHVGDVPDACLIRHGEVVAAGDGPDAGAAGGGGAGGHDGL
jgi:2-phosphosulfolactate phosphatase